MAAGRAKKIICGTEGEIVVAHGRLPSPAPKTKETTNSETFYLVKDQIHK